MTQWQCSDPCLKSRQGIGHQEYRNISKQQIKAKHGKTIPYFQDNGDQKIQHLHLHVYRICSSSGEPFAKALQRFKRAASSSFKVLGMRLGGRVSLHRKSRKSMRSNQSSQNSTKGRDPNEIPTRFTIHCSLLKRSLQFKATSDL